MVKLRAGKKKQAALKDSAVVSSDFKKTWRIPGFSKIDFTRFRTNRKLMIYAGCLLGVLLIIVGGTLLYKQLHKPPVVQLQSEEQYVSKKINEMERNAPGKDTSQSDKIKYYESLEIHYDLAKDYEKAVEAFQKRSEILSSDLDYLDYARLGRYYSNLNRKENAIAALDKAISLLPPTANESTGYDPNIVKSNLEQAKERLQ